MPEIDILIGALNAADENDSADEVPEASDVWTGDARDTRPDSDLCP